jgi:hypothetical protein
MADDKDKPADAAPVKHEPAKEADAKPRKPTHEEFMQTLRDNPHFRVIPPTGEGFIIGPVPPKKPDGHGA